MIAGSIASGRFVAPGTITPGVHSALSKERTVSDI
jgi:hypothetical protein